MNHLKPMMIVFLMLISTLAGCTGNDGSEGVQDPQGEIQNQIDWANDTLNYQYLDFTGSRLFMNANLSGANFNHAILVGTNFFGADLSGAKLIDTDLWASHFEFANLTGADLTGADLRASNARHLEGGCPASLPSDWLCIHSSLVGPGAYMGNSIHLRYANLSGANLYGINIQGADLSGANLSGTNLSGPSIDDWTRKLNADDANLTMVDLSHSELVFVSFRDTDLSYANLSYADLSDSDMWGADLTGADLTGVTWYDTTCPDGTNSDDNGDTCENNL